MLRQPIVKRLGGSVAKLVIAGKAKQSMTNCRSQLQGGAYFRVLLMLQDNPDMTQREIAEKLGISSSWLNYCLKALIERGWVKVQNFSQSKTRLATFMC